MNRRIFLWCFTTLAVFALPRWARSADPVKERGFCAPPVTNSVEDAVWFKPVVTGYGSDLSHGAQRLAVTIATLSGQVGIYRTSDGSLERILNGHYGINYVVAFSPNGQPLATGGNLNSIYISRLGDGVVVTNLEAHSSPIFALVFSPDAQFLCFRGCKWQSESLAGGGLEFGSHLAGGHARRRPCPRFFAQ